MKVISRAGKVLEQGVEETLKRNSADILQTPSEIIMEIGSQKAKNLVDEILLTKEVEEANKDGYIHITDREYYLTKSLNNLQYPLDKILRYGFKADLCSLRPAKRIETAGVLSYILMEIVQNEMHGGQSIPAFDFYLAPYVRMTFKEELNKIGDFIGRELIDLYNYELEDYIVKDTIGLEGDEKYIQEAINNTVRKVYQAMESFICNMNTIYSRIGNHAIFSTINYGTDTSAEGRCVIRQLLLVTERGIGNNETPIFPVQIWKKKNGINAQPGDKNYDLFKCSCLVSAKRYYPNYINLDASFNQNELWNEKNPNRYKYECSTMGCATRVFENRFGEKTSIGRGNLSFSTVNLPRLAIESAKEAQEKTGIQFAIGKNSGKYITEDYKKIVTDIFMNKLQKYADMIAKQLYDRYCFQASAIKKQFPLLMSGLWKDSENLDDMDKVESVLKYGTLEIGFIGLAECLTALIGKHHGESEEAQELGLKIVSKLKELTDKYSDEYDLNYCVFGSPAERLSGRFVKNDKEKFGAIEGVTDKEYYTNSNHVPVWFKCSQDKKAKIEGPYHKLMLGGHIFLVELKRGVQNSAETIENVVDLMDKYDIGYCAVNFPRTKCANCGFEINKTDVKYCSVCDGENIEQIQRLAGYLVGTTDKWNSSNLAELADRVVHDEE